MNEFIWQETLRLDNALVDDQHEKLFELANKLTHASDKDDVAHQTTLLFNHVRDHFSTEEQFMRDHHYPGLQQHVENHDLMLIELVSISEKIKNDEWQQPDIEAFMRQWVNHILDDDTALTEFLQRRLA